MALPTLDRGLTVSPCSNQRNVRASRTMKIYKDGANPKIRRGRWWEPRTAKYTQNYDTLMAA